VSMMKGNYYHFPGICLEGLGKATHPVRIFSVRELPRTDRSIARLFDRYFYRLDKRRSGNRDSANWRILCSAIRIFL
jgi:hypothetical protein